MFKKILFQTLFLMTFTTVNLNSGNNPQNIPSKPKSPNELKILTWNIYMLPHCNILNGNKKRARVIAEQLKHSEYDIIMLEEAFDYRARKILKHELKTIYPYIYGPANESFLSLRTNSGLWILSKIPLTKIKEIEYEKRKGIDAMARKGAVMFEGNWFGHEFQLVGTHLQADSPDEIRREQCRQIASDLLEKYAKQNVPQFVCGDFNIEMSDTDNYHYMLNVLNAQNGHLEGDINVTYDEIDNVLAKKQNGKKYLIDYILLRNHNAKIANVKRRISVFKNVIDNKLTDLSDHYGVEALVNFR